MAGHEGQHIHDNAYGMRRAWEGDVFTAMRTQGAGDE